MDPLPSNPRYFHNQELTELKGRYNISFCMICVPFVYQEMPKNCCKDTPWNAKCQLQIFFVFLPKLIYFELKENKIG